MIWRADERARFSLPWWRAGSVASLWRAVVRARYGLLFSVPVSLQVYGVLLERASLPGLRFGVLFKHAWNFTTQVWHAVLRAWLLLCLLRFGVLV